MITDHVYQSDYAGLDPNKQRCTYYYDAAAESCAARRDQHVLFLNSPREISDVIGGAPPDAENVAVSILKDAGMNASSSTPDDFEWFDHCEVNLIESTFNDDTVCFAAWTSTKGDEADHNARKGLINRLMKDRHGSPFEHMWIQFQITAPIFTWREHHRHRMASYNEESARYRTMRPRFYIPPRHRPMVQVEGTKAMDYVMTEAQDSLYEQVKQQLIQASFDGYDTYQRLLSYGVVREVARMCLPVNLMSTCIVTMNARALMNFLSLRVKNAGAAYPTNPQWEINRVANEYERHFARLAPLTHEAFVSNGRVAP